MTYPVFTNGTVLPASDLNAIGLWLVKSQTIGSGVSSVTVTDAFSSSYDNYRIVIASPDASGDGAFYYLQLGTTATGYYGSCFYDNYNGASTGTARRNNSSLWEIGVSGSLSNTEISLDIASPNLAKETSINGTYTGGGWSGWFGGYQSASTQFTSLVLTIQSGTFTGGTISVYGYRKA